MANRPQTAKSEISSAISDDGLPAPPPLLPPPLPSDRSRSNTPGLPSPGFPNFSGVTNPTNRSLRSPVSHSAYSGTSRPQSPEGTTSRTHVPSLTAQGFLKPMSSSRLQQQRLSNLRAARARESSRSATGTEPIHDDEDTQSVRSGPYASMPKQHRPTASITTGYTESEAAENYDSISQRGRSEADNEYFRGHSPEKKQIPAPLDLRSSLNISGNQDKPLRSPHSFRSGLSIGGKQVIPRSHQHLPSNEPSPRYQDMQEKRYVAQQSALGRNYEYFEGNNVFWLGGRIQNARDRPINLLTGILIVTPCILFFIFS
ncbi:hypothetical protein ES702_03578 [subsurface metagenome]